MMRPYLLIATLFISATPALGQSYQPYPLPTHPQQEASVAYPAQAGYPQPAYAAPAQQPPQVPVMTQPYYEPHQVETIQPIVTDVRQMNF